MKRIAILMAMTIALAATASHAEAPRGTIAFHRIEGEPLTTFAARFFYKRHPHAVNWSFAKRYRADENWTEIVHNQVYAADVDLNDDGTPELILVVDNPNWCQANGCLGAIFRSVPKGYELICETALPPPEQPALTVLPEIENGYHHIATQDQTILWNARQDYDAGTLCATESSN